MSVDTDTTTAVFAETQTPSTGDANQSDKTTTPQLEVRDGKHYIDGVRVYSRDDTNRIAASAKEQAISTVLRDLDVDSLDQVREVLTTIKSTHESQTDKIDVAALKQAVARREATVEELQTQVSNLRSELVLKDHISKLDAEMPSNWNSDQRSAVLDLMRARNMLVLEGDKFAIKSGSDYLTQDGETPDYAGAVETMAKSLGLSTGKRGVDLYTQDRTAQDATPGRTQPVDQERLKTDAEYRTAYMNIRQYQPNVHRTEITHQQLVKQIDSGRRQRAESYNRK